MHIMVAHVFISGLCAHFLRYMGSLPRSISTHICNMKEKDLAGKSFCLHSEKE